MLLGLYMRTLSLWSGLQARFRNEEGVIATEYLVLMVFIALAIIAGATALGFAINSKLSSVSGCLDKLTCP
jgi:Flp pilus assembly pilin Flp